MRFLCKLKVSVFNCWFSFEKVTLRDWKFKIVGKNLIIFLILRQNIQQIFGALGLDLLQHSHNEKFSWYLFSVSQLKQSSKKSSSCNAEVINIVTVCRGFFLFIVILTKRRRYLFELRRVITQSKRFIQKANSKS